MPGEKEFRDKLDAALEARKNPLHAWLEKNLLMVLAATGVGTGGVTGIVTDRVSDTQNQEVYAKHTADLVAAMNEVVSAANAERDLALENGGLARNLYLECNDELKEALRKNAIPPDEDPQDE